MTIAGTTPGSPARVFYITGTENPIHERLVSESEIKPATAPTTVTAVTNASMARIREYVKSAYEPQVWFGGLQAFSLAARERAHAFSTKKFVMSTYSMAGRAMQTLTLLPSKHEITLITAENESEPRMGISSVYATEASALKLLKLVTETWQAGAIKLKADRGVTLG